MWKHIKSGHEEPAVSLSPPPPKAALKARVWVKSSGSSVPPTTQPHKHITWHENGGWRFSLKPAGDGGTLAAFPVWGHTDALGHHDPL